MRATVRFFRRPAWQMAPILLGLATPVWAAAPAEVSVELANARDGSQVMRLDRSQVPAGRVRFTVRNLSRDMTHEFLVVRTKLAPSDLPMTAAGSRVDEKKLHGVEELGDLGPGKSVLKAMTLRPGHYVLFCNEPGHFKAGMRAELAVTE